MKIESMLVFLALIAATTAQSQMSNEDLDKLLSATEERSKSSPCNQIEETYDENTKDCRTFKSRLFNEDEIASMVRHYLVSKNLETLPEEISKLFPDLVPGELELSEFCSSETIGLIDADTKMLNEAKMMDLFDLVTDEKLKSDFVNAFQVCRETENASVVFEIECNAYMRSELCSKYEENMAEEASSR